MGVKIIPFLLALSTILRFPSFSAHYNTIPKFFHYTMMWLSSHSQCALTITLLCSPLFVQASYDGKARLQLPEPTRASAIPASVEVDTTCPGPASEANGWRCPGPGTHDNFIPCTAGNNKTPRLLPEWQQSRGICGVCKMEKRIIANTRAAAESKLNSSRNSLTSATQSNQGGESPAPANTPMPSPTRPSTLQHSSARPAVPAAIKTPVQPIFSKPS